MAKIYTKTGDNKTSSRGNERALKSDLIFEVIGTVDEAQSELNLALKYIEKSDVLESLEIIIKKMSILSASFIFPKMYKMTPDDTIKLENEIDKYEEIIGEMKNFIFIFDNLGACYLNKARCTVRRLERRIVALSNNEEVDKNIQTFVNRLSDLIFTMQRYLEENK